MVDWFERHLVIPYVTLLQGFQPLTLGLTPRQITRAANGTMFGTTGLNSNHARDDKRE
jgi:hypothetical protein